MKKIKVANIIEEGRLGGPQIRISEVANKIDQDSFETVVIFPCRNSFEFQNQLDKYGIRYLMLDLNRLTKAKKDLIRYILFFFYEIIQLFLIFRKHRFDIVHVSGGIWQIKGAIAGKLCGSKVLWHLNDTGMPKLIRYGFKLFADRLAHGFIVAGEKVRKYYIDSFKIGRGKPVFEIQAPVNYTVFDPQKVEKDTHLLSKEGLNIVSVGNINPFKGFEFLIGAAGILNKDFSYLNFWIVGPCFDSQWQYYRMLKEKVTDHHINNMFFYGRCNDIPAVLKSADIYVCSSVSEASPLSVWEAMSMAKPVVSTDVGDVSRFIQSGRNGYVVPVGDTKKMAGMIKILIEDEGRRKRFGQMARETAVKELGLDKCVVAHEKAYKHILNKEINV